MSDSSATFAKEKEFIVDYFKSISELPLPQLRKFLLQTCETRFDDAHQKLTIKEILNSFKEGNGKAAIHFAAARGDLEVFQYLLQEGADPHVLDGQENSPLFIAVQHDHLPITRHLIDTCHADVKVQRRSVTPLHVAAQNGSIPMIELLLSSGADLNALSDFGTPVCFALACSQNFAARHLLTKGPDLELAPPDMPPLLLLVIDQDNQEIFNEILPKANPNSKDPQGYSALQLCAEKGALTMLKALVGRGADVDYENLGRTALDMAAQNNHLECMAYLREVARRKEPVLLAEQPKQQELSEGEADEIMKQVVALKEQGNLELKAQQYSKAKDLYVQAVQLGEALGARHAEGLARICTNLAQAQIGLKDFQGALEICRKARKLDPSWVKAYYYEGLSYEGLKEYGEAAASYFEALKISKNDPYFKTLFDNAIAQGKKAYLSKSR